MIFLIIVLAFFLQNQTEANEKQDESISNYFEQGHSLEYTLPDSAIRLYHLAYKLGVKYDSLLLQAKAKYYIGTVYLQQGLLDSCKPYLEDATDRFEKIGETEYICKSLIAIANYYNYNASYEDALLTYQKAFDQALDMSDELMQARILSNQSSIFNLTGRIEAALSVLGKAEAIAEHLGQTVVKGDIYNNLSINYQAKKDYDKAATYAEKAAAIYHIEGDHLYEALALTNLSAYLHEKNPPDLAGSIKALEQSRSILDTLKAPSIEINYFKHLTYYYYKKEAFEKAEKAAKNCLRLLQEFPHLQSESNIYEMLYKINKAKGQPKEALSYHEKFVIIQDSLVFQDNREQLQELQLKYEASRKDNEIATQRLKINRQTSQRNILLLGLSLLGITLLFFFFQYKKNQRLASEKLKNLKRRQKIMVMDSMLHGQEEERKRIAKDLHDGLGSLLAAARIQMVAVHREINKLGNLTHINKTTSLIDHACKEVRRISHDMMPSTLIELGLVEAINDMIDDLHLRRDYLIKVDLPEKVEHLDDTTALNIYRIIQEALQNIIKHAQANIIELHLSIDKNEATLIIEDDGIGFDMISSTSGLGIQSIKSRVQYLNGQFGLESGVHKGCRYHIKVPLPSVKAHV